MSDLAIRVENLSKRYRIGARQTRHDTLRDALTSTFQRFNVQTFKRSSVQSFQRSASDLIWALKDVSFEVKRGEVVGIIGRNGAGKSTLLKILARITKPTTGYADLYGRVASLLEIGTGFHQELTGRENIYLSGAILGMKKAEIDRKFDEIVAFSEIEKFIDTPVKRYSSGMYVRLAFAVAAHLEPEILLVDEVLAVGDAAFQKKCLGKMGDVAKEGRTVLFVSHNMAAVNNLCSHGLLLSSGLLSFDGLIDQCISRYVSNLESGRHEWLRSDKVKGPLSLDRILVDLNGRDNQTVLNVEIHLSSTGQHKPAYVAIDISDATGVNIMQAIPTIEPFISNAVSRHHKATVVINLPPLIPGHYFVSVWVGSHNIEMLDSVDKCVSFDITESPTPGRTFPHTRDHGYIVPMSTLKYEAMSVMDP